MQPLAQTPLKIVEQHGWLYAELIDSILVVYRSVAVKDSDQNYQPVAKLLEQNYEVCFDEVLEDETMMYGKAQSAVYLLGGTNE